jgi:hypothetical protein
MIVASSTRRQMLCAIIVVFYGLAGLAYARALKDRDKVNLLPEHLDIGAVYIYVSPNQCGVCDVALGTLIKTCKKCDVPVHLFVEKCSDKQARIAVGDRRWDAGVTGDEMLLYREHFRVTSVPEALVVNAAGVVIERASLFQASQKTVRRLESAIRKLSDRIVTTTFPDWARPLNEESFIVLKGMDVDSLGKLMSTFPTIIWDEAKRKYFIVNSERKTTFAFSEAGSYERFYSAVPRNSDYESFYPTLVRTINDSTGLYYMDSDINDAKPFIYRYDLTTDSAVYHRVYDDSIFVTSDIVYDPRRESIYDGFSPYYGAPERKGEDHLLSIFKAGKYDRFLGTPPDEVYNAPLTRFYYRVLTGLTKNGVAFMSSISDSLYYYDYQHDSLQSMPIQFPDSSSEKWHSYYRFKDAQPSPEQTLSTGRHFSWMLLGEKGSESLLFVTGMSDTTSKRFKKYGLEPAFGVSVIDIKKSRQSQWYSLPYGVIPHTMKDGMLVCSSRKGDALYLHFYKIE